MTTIHTDENFPPAGVDFLKHCYIYINQKWPHEERDDSPDQGFERRFRASCHTDIVGWQTSQHREMNLGSELSTASGILHEIDIVARHTEVSAILELKNRQGPPAKNDVIILFAKMLDYFTQNPELLLKEICPVFLSTAAFEPNALAACLGLGIHPVGPMLRPAPVLIDNAKRMSVEFRRGIRVSEEVREAFDDYCAELNRVSLNLRDSWISSRFGYVSDSTVVVHSGGDADTQDLAYSLMQLNRDCDRLLQTMREAAR